MRTIPISLCVLLTSAMVVSGCAARIPAADGPVVVATTNILGSVVGDLVECAGETAKTLLPVGVDPHDFSASSEQVAHLVSAQLVVANGLGLEGGLADAIAGAEAEGAVVLEVAPLVDPIVFRGGSSAGSSEGGSLDPRFWHDVSRMAVAAEALS